MQTVSHPLLPYSLQFDPATGYVARKRFNSTEEGSPADLAVAILLTENEALKARVEALENPSPPPD